MSRLPAQVEMAKWLQDAGQEIVGSRFFEVGTGHVPVAPIGLFLCGAGSTVTVDLNRRIEGGLTRESLEWMAAHRNEVFSTFESLVNDELFADRYAILTRLQQDLVVFFKEAEIE